MAAFAKSDRFTECVAFSGSIAKASKNFYRIAGSGHGGAAKILTTAPIVGYMHTA